MADINAPSHRLASASGDDKIGHGNLGQGAMLTDQVADSMVGEVGDVDVEKQKRAEGDAHFHRLGWKRLTVVLIVEAIALGALSLPSAFHTLGMVAGVILCVGIGLVAMYSSYVVGQTKLKYPQISHYADAGRLMMGRFGYEVIGFMFVLQLTFTTASHVLTGTIMWNNLTAEGACSVLFGLVSAVILFALAIPPSFAEVAILGYIDFVSILVAILITMVATGSAASRSLGGLAAVSWSAWPKEGVTLAQAFIAIANIVFAYSFAMCQFSFMNEMHTPADFPKSILALGLIEMVVYTVTGGVVYAFVGADVRAPALLSAGPLVSKIAFGLAIPVIFISGSINTTVIARYLHKRCFKDTVTSYINTPWGWVSWLLLVLVITVVAWLIAEAIPFFQDLLAICSSLFISGFSFYLPAVMWFMFIKEGKWTEPRNVALTILNAAIFLLGLLILGLGTYSAIRDIADSYAAGTVSGSFSCTSSA